MRSPFTRQFLAASLLSGCAVAVQPANASTISRTYTDLGQIASYDGPRSDVSDVIHYTYDAQGNLATVTNPLGQVVTLSGYDSFGNSGLVTMTFLISFCQAGGAQLDS